MAEKLSEGLKAKLSEQDRNAIQTLFDFKDMFEEFCEISLCTPEMREEIANKELSITCVIDEIVKIKNMKISNDKKSEKIHDLLKGTDIDHLIEEVNEEIARTKKIMITKIKEMSKMLGAKGKEAKSNFDRYIDESIEYENSSVAAKKARKKEILEGEKKAEKEETAMIEYEGGSFWDNFKKIRQDGLEKNGKKTGIVKSLFKAVKTTYIGDDEPEEPTKSDDSKETKVTTPKEPETKTKRGILDRYFRKATVEELTVKPKSDGKTEKSDAEKKVENLEKEMTELDKAIEAAEERVRQLKQQKLDVATKLEKAQEEALEEAKAKLDKATAPIPEAEITEERVGGLFAKIKAFREKRNEKKIDKLQGQMDQLKTEMDQAREVMNSSRGFEREEAALDLRYLEKSYAKKEKSLNKRLERSNKGMDR